MRLLIPICALTAVMSVGVTAQDSTVKSKVQLSAVMLKPGEDDADVKINMSRHADAGRPDESARRRWRSSRSPAPQQSTAHIDNP